ncbi:MAG: uroporphyrinogen-III synthase, partial [Anaerotignum sp.]|nr:uroporphyrinogen-III synthase [Anaerotignum sp.]
YSWAVFTSPNGVEIFFDYLKKVKFDVRKLANLNFAVIGTGTAAALEKRGIYASYLPEKYDVESLAKGLCETVKKDEKILVLRAEQGSEILTEVLDDAGMTYTDVKIYDIHVDKDKRNFANEKAKEMDFITFASGSGVRGFMENGGTIPAGTMAVCIGSSTARMLKKYGDYEKITAETFNVDGVVEIILKEVGK